MPQIPMRNLQFILRLTAIQLYHYYFYEYVRQVICMNNEAFSSSDLLHDPKSNRPLCAYR